MEWVSMRNILDGVLMYFIWLIDSFKNTKKVNTITCIYSVHVHEEVMNNHESFAQYSTSLIYATNFVYSIHFTSICFSIVQWIAKYYLIKLQASPYYWECFKWYLLAIFVLQNINLFLYSFNLKKCRIEVLILLTYFFNEYPLQYTLYVTSLFFHLFYY